MGGVVFPNPKTFVNLKNSAFLGQKQCFLGKKCTITWYILHISYFIFHISYFIFHIAYFIFFWIRGSQKGGVGGGGGGPTFGKNSQIISFFFERAYLKGFEVGK